MGFLSAKFILQRKDTHKKTTAKRSVFLRATFPLFGSRSNPVSIHFAAKGYPQKNNCEAVGFRVAVTVTVTVAVTISVVVTVAVTVAVAVAVSVAVSVAVAVAGPKGVDYSSKSTSKI